MKLPTREWASNGKAPLALAVYAWRGAVAELGYVRTGVLFARVGFDLWQKSKKTSARRVVANAQTVAQSARTVERQLTVTLHE